MVSVKRCVVCGRNMGVMHEFRTSRANVGVSKALGVLTNRVNLDYAFSEEGF